MLAGRLRGLDITAANMATKPFTVRPVITVVVAMPIKVGVGHMETISKGLEDKIIVISRAVKLWSVPIAKKGHIEKFCRKKKKDEAKKINAKAAVSNINRESSGKAKFDLISVFCLWEREYQRVSRRCVGPDCDVHIS